jgi:hypothetical protein
MKISILKVSEVILVSVGAKLLNPEESNSTSTGLTRRLTGYSLTSRLEEANRSKKK